MDELVTSVGRAASLPPEQAAVAVGTMLRFLAARLPSPLFGELQAHLNPQAAAGTAARAGPPTSAP